MVDKVTGVKATRDGPTHHDDRTDGWPLADLINQLSHQETDPDRQLTAWEAPETLGFVTADGLRS